jgi:phage terminase large subunit-like protein
MTFSDVLMEVATGYSQASEDPRLAWHGIARPEQRLPPGDWRVWYMQGGRGSGKTRGGAQGLAELILNDTDAEGEYGVIAPTYADAWTKCIEGKAGILRALGTSMKEIKDHRSQLVRSAWRTYGQVVLYSGLVIYVDSAAEGGLRVQGRNLKAIWADEIGLWEKWETAWNESVRYAVREGVSKIIATGTPKASRPARKLIRSLIRNDPAEGGVIVTRLRTVDNAANLSDAFLRSVVGVARGTRLERQELEGELLDDVANALWTRDLLDLIRVAELPGHLRNVCIGVDPSDGSEDSDEQAYTVSGQGMPEDKHLYVAESWGGQEDPATFARRVIRKAMEWHATVLVEKNHGGKWLTTVFTQVQKEMNTSVRVRVVHASDAKRTRAEPVAAMYTRYSEDGTPLVRHLHRTWEDDEGHRRVDEHMPELEDQMATYTGAQGERSPDRLDSLVWSMNDFLRATFGVPGAGGAREWAVQKELAEAGEPPRSHARRRMAHAHNGMYDPDTQSLGFGSAGVYEGFELDDFAPRDGGGADRPAGQDRNNVKRWR